MLHCHRDGVERIMSDGDLVELAIETLRAIRPSADRDLGRHIGSEDADRNCPVDLDTVDVEHELGTVPRRVELVPDPGSRRRRRVR